jgi:hypothetical protein
MLLDWLEDLGNGAAAAAKRREWAEVEERRMGRERRAFQLCRALLVPGAPHQEAWPIPPDVTFLLQSCPKSYVMHYSCPALYLMINVSFKKNLTKQVFKFCQHLHESQNKYENIHKASN